MGDLPSKTDAYIVPRLGRPPAGSIQLGSRSPGPTRAVVRGVVGLSIGELGQGVVRGRCNGMSQSRSPWV